MSVRKRKWIWKGQEREAWIVVYTDQGGERQHIRDAEGCKGLGRVYPHRGQ